MLTGKCKPGAPLPAESRAAHGSMGAMLPKRWLRVPLLTAVQQVNLLAEREAGVTLTRFALAWVLRKQEVSSAIIGATRPEQWWRTPPRQNARLCPSFSRGPRTSWHRYEKGFGMESGPPIPIYGRGIFTTDIRCKRRDLNAGQQFFQYPGFDPQPLAIAASSAMIAAPRG